jgi:DNA-directed RNA polymerase specialized sigma24 family protein
MKRLSNQIGALTTLKQLNLDENQLDRVTHSFLQLTPRKRVVVLLADALSLPYANVTCSCRERYLS